MASRDWENWMWHQAEDLLHEAERIRRSFLESAVSARNDPMFGHTSWGPPVNVIETEDAFWIVAALPGVEAEQITIRIEEGCLVLEGQRTFGEELKEGTLHILEIPIGPFERRLRLPAGFEFKVGTKSLSNGLLLIELRKVA